MPRLRRLSGKEVVAILNRFGFETVRVRGSHHQLKSQEGPGPVITVPLHGNEPLQIGTLKSIYRQACTQIPEDDLRPYFYAD
jgi:predicted RNA binding protein YcfA (HicA-like mRNA interferase family)